MVTTVSLLQGLFFLCSLFLCGNTITVYTWAACLLSVIEFDVQVRESRRR